MSMGSDSKAEGEDVVALGAGSSANGLQALAIVMELANGVGVIAIGSGAKALGYNTNGVAIGTNRLPWHRRHSARRRRCGNRFKLYCDWCRCNGYPHRFDGYWCWRSLNCARSRVLEPHRAIWLSQALEPLANLLGAPHSEVRPGSSPRMQQETLALRLTQK